MSSLSTSNVTSGFIDLATFDEIEKYMYGGPDATAYLWPKKLHRHSRLSYVASMCCVT